MWAPIINKSPIDEFEIYNFGPLTRELGVESTYKLSFEMAHLWDQDFYV